MPNGFLSSAPIPLPNAKGIAASRLQAKGYGETIPKGDNTTEKGKEENRRTEFRIVKK